MHIPDAIIDTLRQARQVTVFTGAGISAESGIATFRDKGVGLWQRYNPADLATPEAYLRDPALVWGWYEARRLQVSAAQPNAGHLAIVELAKRKNEIKVSAIFKTLPEPLLRMVVVHELAHLREKDHSKAFYQLCRHMEPDYHQLELDLRLFLTLRS